MENLVDLLKERLKSEGYKLTPQRRAILDTIIENQGKHLNTEEIYNLVKKVSRDWVGNRIQNIAVIG